jgi:quinol-cytochrome oxidoreductase complex cytochrome b subunit
MSQTIAIIIYIVFCLLAGICGTNRRMGFLGTFLMSLIVTPVIALLVLMLTAPATRDEKGRRPQSN